jgi:hypothetical protein
MKPYSLAYLIGVSTVSLSLTTIACGSSAQHLDAAAGGGNGGSASGGSSGTGGSNGGGSASGGSNGTGGGSGTPGGSTCGKVLPCGGDLLGAWTLTESCADLATQPAPTCPDQRIVSWTPTVSGNWTFNADMTYSRSTITSVVVVWNIPLSCIPALAATCADFEAQAQATLAADETIACTGTSTCICTETRGARSQSDNGTYAVTGSDVTYTSAVSGTTGTGPYCVRDSRLHFVTLDPRAANGIGSDIVGRQP